MGKYGWEIKAFTLNSNGGPGDVAIYVLQKTVADSYQSTSEQQPNKKSSLRLVRKTTTAKPM